MSHEPHDHTGACFVCAAAQTDSSPSNPSGPGPTRRSFLAAALGGSLAAPLLAHAASDNSQASGGDVDAGPYRNEGRHYVIDAGLALVEVDGALKIRRNVAILVDGDRIVDIEDSSGASRRYGEAARLDARRHFVVPGFISGHTHVAGGSAHARHHRGRPLLRQAARTPRWSSWATRSSTRSRPSTWPSCPCSAAAPRRSRCPSTSRRPGPTKGRRQAWGVRGYVGGMISGTRRDCSRSGSGATTRCSRTPCPAPCRRSPTTSPSAVQAEGGRRARLQPMMAPHATDTHTPETMAPALLAAARELGTGLDIHLSQSQRPETDTVKRLWGATPTQWLWRSSASCRCPVFGAHMTGMELPTGTCRSSRRTVSSMPIARRPAAREAAAGSSPGSRGPLGRSAHQHRHRHAFQRL